MKIRISEGSLQYRLSARDVDLLASGNTICSGLSFGQDGELTFSLEPDSGVESIRAEMTGTTVRVRIPGEWASTWNEDDRIGFEATVTLDNGDTMDVQVEKDLRWFRKPKEGDDGDRKQAE